MNVNGKLKIICMKSAVLLNLSKFSIFIKQCVLYTYIEIFEFTKNVGCQGITKNIFENG